jgi:hypothetical protein
MPSVHVERTAENLAGIPDTLPPQYCPKCKATVTPRGKGLCPGCGRVLRQSFLHRRSPVNLGRQKQILGLLVIEYQPTSTRSHSTCETLASVLEGIERNKAGSPEHQRLTQQRQVLFDELDAAKRLLSQQPSPESAGIDHVSTPSLERALALLRRRAAGEQLTERELGQLDILTDAMAGLLQLDHPQLRGDDDDPDAEPDEDEDEEDDGGDPDDEPTDAVPLVEPPAAMPVTYCKYCSADPCRGEADPLFRDYHFDDPQEQARRAREAAETMRESLRRSREGLR